MHLDELKVVHEEEKDEIESADGGEGFEVKAKAVEEDAIDQVVDPQVVAAQ